MTAIMYIFFRCPAVMSAIIAKSYIIPNIRAMLSIRIYTADSANISADTAMLLRRGNANNDTVMENTVYIAADMSSPVLSLFSNSFLSLTARKQKRGRMTASLTTSYNKLTHESCPAME